MELKIVPMLAVMAMMAVFVVSMQPASAAHQTVLKAYNYDPYDPPGNELGKEMTIKKGDVLDISATLHVDGANPQWFRWIHYYVYDPKGNQIVNEERNSGFGGIARCWINSRDWETGTYKISLIYWGNEEDGYPSADKEVNLRIV
ncbi:MAG: hypothetical protein NKF70_12860 [Methanobacterium sp. ERen5]|nr:MAG: hypothetical protein NKF70_12860 [Methanobacterium sp. ERen5]